MAGEETGMSEYVTSNFDESRRFANMCRRLRHWVAIRLFELRGGTKKRTGR